MFKSLCSATGQATPCRFCGEGWKLTPCVEFRLQNSFECNSLADPDRWADRSMCLPDGVTYTLSICFLKLKACRQQHSQIMENRACTSSPLEEPQEIFRKDFFSSQLPNTGFGSIQYICIWEACNIYMAEDQMLEREAEDEQFFHTIRHAS